MGFSTAHTHFGMQAGARQISVCNLCLCCSWECRRFAGCTWVLVNICLGRSRAAAGGLARSWLLLR